MRKYELKSLFHNHRPDGYFPPEYIFGGICILNPAKKVCENRYEGREGPSKFNRLVGGGVR